MNATAPVAAKRARQPLWLWRALLVFFLSLAFIGFGEVALADDDHDDVTGPRNNIVEVVNTADGTRQFRGRIQVNTIDGGTVDPGNLAFAYASCDGCQSLAVALQLNLVEGAPTTVAPENVALALNESCTGCYTWADAYQKTVSVDDAEEVLDELEDDIARLDRRLRALSWASWLTTEELQARAEAIIAEFKTLVANAGSTESDDEREDWDD